MSDFTNYTHPKARKNYRCEWCGEGIPKGEVHAHFVGIWEGDWQNWRMHDECYDYSTSTDECQEGFSPFENERPKKQILTVAILRKCYAQLIAVESKDPLIMLPISDEVRAKLSE